MLTYDELAELAVMCAYNARIATSAAVAMELWSMAEEYQRKAAEFGRTPQLGEPPPLVRRSVPTPSWQSASRV